MQCSNKTPWRPSLGTLMRLLALTALLAAAGGAGAQEERRVLNELRLKDVGGNSAPPIARDPTRPGQELVDALRKGASAQGGGIARVLINTNDPPAATIEARIIDVAEFVRAPFSDVARLLGESTGINIVSSPSANSVTVNLYLSRIPVGELLENLCNAHGMWLKREPGSRVVRVYTVGEFRQDLASFREEKTEVFTLLYPNAFDIANAIQDLYGDRVQVSQGEYDTEMTQELMQRLMRFDIIDQRSSGLGGAKQGGGQGGGGSGMGATVGLGGMGMGSGMGGMGGGMGGMGGMGGRQRRVPQAPTMLMATNLGAEQIQTLSDAASQGGQTGAVSEIITRRVTIYVTVLRRQNKLLVRTADESAMVELRALIPKLDVPTSHVLLEVKVMRVELGDGILSAFDYSSVKGVGDGLVNGSFNQGEIMPPAYAGPPINDPVQGMLPIAPNFNPGGGGFRNDAFVFQYLGQNVRARLQLLEQKNKLTTLATPMLLVANNEVSRLFVGEERPINRGFSGQGVVQSGLNNFNTVATTDIDFRPVGTTLLMTPNINADRTVTLRLVQETSSIRERGANVLVPQGAGFTERPVDTVQTRTVSGTFIAQDKLAVVVGGMVEEQVNKQRAGIPVISRIPVLGAAFRRDDVRSARSELVVVIRPFILNTPQEAEKISKDLLSDLSLHPNAPVMGQGTMRTFRTNDVAVPKQPKQKKPKTEFRK